MATPILDTRQKILESARLTVQSRGYAGLSFRELAKDVGIKSASIHYYFPSKGDLGAVLAQKYTEDMAGYLEGLLDGTHDRQTCLKKYTEVFRTTLRNDNRMCLGGMMAAEHDEVPAEVQVEVVKFGEMNVRWLARALALPTSPRKKAPAASRSPLPSPAQETQALAIFAAIHGAQLVARSRGDVAVYDAIVAAYRASGLIP